MGTKAAELGLNSWMGFAALNGMKSAAFAFKAFLKSQRRETNE